MRTVILLAMSTFLLFSCNKKSSDPAPVNTIENNSTYNPSISGKLNDTDFNFTYEKTKYNYIYGNSSFSFGSGYSFQYYGKVSKGTNEGLQLSFNTKNTENNDKSTFTQLFTTGTKTLGGLQGYKISYTNPNGLTFNIIDNDSTTIQINEVTELKNFKFDVLGTETTFNNAVRLKATIQNVKLKYYDFPNQVYSDSVFLKNTNIDIFLAGQDQ
jgi:hypothetical protein